MIPTLDDLLMEYRLYCAALPLERKPEDFAVYIYHALTEQNRWLVEQIAGLQYCRDLLVEQNKALQDDQWCVTMTRWMREREKA